MAAPNITATIVGRDELTPVLQRLAVQALAIAEGFKAIGAPIAELNGALRNSIAHAEAMARVMATAFDQGKLGRFTASIASATGNMDRLGGATEKANQRLTAMEGKAARVKNEFASLHQLASNLAGILPLVLGGGVAHAGVKMVENAAEYEQAKNKVYTARKDNQGEVDTADRLAGDVARRHPLVTRTRALEDYVELRSLAADDGGNVNAEQLGRNVRVMAKARQALAAMGQTLTEHDARSLAQAVEGSGRAGDPAAQEKIVDAYIRGKGVYGSAIDAAKLRDFVANAKSANFPMGDDAFYYTTMARLAQGNAPRLGNEFSQTYNTLVGGKMTKQGAQWLVDTGQITQEQIVDGKGGKFYIRGDIKGKDQLAVDQTAWAQNVLLPGLEKKGVLADEKIAKRMDTMRAAERKANPNAQVDEHALRERAVHGLIADDLSKAGFRSTVTDNLVHAIANEALIRKDVAQMKAHQGIEAADTISRNPIAALHELTAALADLGIVIANPAMQAGAAALDGLANAIAAFAERLSGLQKEHPWIAGVGAVAVPAGLIGGGGALMLGILSNIFGGGMKASAVALDGSAVALTGSAAALEAAAVALGGAAEAGMIGKAGAAAAGAAGGAAGTAAAGGAAGVTATGGVVGAVGTGAAPAAAVAGLALGGIVASAGLALSELNRLAERNGKRPWTAGRLWSMITTGQDEPVTPEEARAEIDRRIAARKAGKAKDLPIPDDGASFIYDPRFWFGDVKKPTFALGKYTLPGKPGAYSTFDDRLDKIREQKDADQDPGASRTFRHWTGAVVGTPSPIESLRELKVSSEAKVSGETQVNISPIRIDASGMATIPGQRVAVPLDSGGQSGGTGSTLNGGAHYGRDNT